MPAAGSSSPPGRPDFQAALAAVRAGLPGREMPSDALVARLVAAGTGTSAPGIGDHFPDFALPDETGRIIRRADLHGRPPRALVLSFQRGRWCPWCRVELAAWAAALPRLTAAGVGFAAITPEAHGRAAAFATSAASPRLPGLTMLADIDLGLSLLMGLAFHPGPALIARYAAIGDDIPAFNGGTPWLPIPATFLLGPDGRVMDAHINPDFRVRADPQTILARLGLP